MSGLLTGSTFFDIITAMNDRLDIFNKLFDGLKFKDATYTESDNTCTMNFLYNPDIFKQTTENRDLLTEKCDEVIGNYVKYRLNFIKCPLDKRAIANHTYTTIINTFPAISKNFTFDDVSVDIDNMHVLVRLRLAPTAYEYAKNMNREILVAEKLKESFLADFTVEFEKKDDEVVVASQIESNMELMSSIKEAEDKTVYELSEITNIIGQNDYSLAIDFTKVNTPIENVAICGEVTSIQKKNYKRNYTRNGVTTEITRVFYNFSIRNDNKVMYCSIFPKQSDEAKGDLIEEGMHICCFGSFREFNGRLNFTAQSVARCVFKKEEIKSQFKPLNEEYHTVFPKEYIDYEQTDMFVDSGKDLNGTYVVFDLETTGLEPAKDEIIEIGACKIKEGEIVETFSTFVKPSRHIPKEIVELTGIDDSMVADAPTINYVMPDFYKFCYGTTLVAHNIQFDISFVYNMAKKLSYNFDNKLMDTLEIARQKLPGLKNYKLSTIVEKLNVVLENAHRAINDATATAKVFIKLMKNY